MKARSLGAASAILACAVGPAPARAATNTVTFTNPGVQRVVLASSQDFWSCWSAPMAELRAGDAGSWRATRAGG